MGWSHKEKLKNKFEDISLNWEASMIRHLALDVSFFDYSMMDRTYFQHLHVKHKQNTYWTLPSDSNNQLDLVQRKVQWFVSECTVWAKTSFLLYISIKVTCKNMTLNHTNGWHLALQTCFHCKTYCASLSVLPVMQYPQTEETITMQILAYAYSLFNFHDFNEFQKF